MRGRPPRPAPQDFDEVFEHVGWEATEYYGTHSARIARWLDERGREKLRLRRRNYVLGKRLSSLKVGSRCV